MSNRKKLKYLESSGRARKVTPRMMEYIGWVIDTPLEGKYAKTKGYVTDKTIGEKMSVTAGRVGMYRNALAERFTKGEILELYEEVMKEVV